MGTERTRTPAVQEGDRRDKGDRRAPSRERSSENLVTMELGRVGTVGTVGSGARLPRSAAQVASLQRLVGNRATSKLMLQRNPPSTGGTQTLQQGLKTDEQPSQDLETSSGQLGGVSNALNLPSGIASGITGGNSSNTVQGAGGVATGGIGAITSIVGIGIDSADLTKRSRQWNKVRKDKDRKGLKRVYGRYKNIAGANVANDVGGLSAGGSSVVGGGMNIASDIGTVSTHAAGVAGVVAGAITLPIQVAQLIRQARRAHLQRKRIVRLQEQAKNVKAKSPTEALKEKQDHLDAEKAALLVADQKLGDLKQKHADSVLALQKLDVDKTLRAGLARRRMRVTGGDTDDETTQPESHDEEIKQQKLAVEQNKTDLDKMVVEQKETAKKVQDAQAEYDGQKQLNETLGDEVTKSGKLTDTGDEDKSVPTLQEISDYAIRKNERGFGRRTIGATAAAVGVVGAGIGLGAGIANLTGNSGLSLDMGIAAGAIAGAAALIGIGVGIWKLVSWAKKRKAQAKKMEEAHKKNANAPMPSGTYNPFKSNVDQSTKRKHMATALYNYIVHGTGDQKTEAYKILSALDKKVDWEKELKHTAQTDAVERDAVISHIANKMGSGG